MNLYEMFLEKKTFSIAIDKDNKIIGVSTCLEQADYGFCGQDVFKIIKEFFVNEYFLNSEAYDEFGGSVAISGDGGTIAVGARGEDSAVSGLNGNQDNNSALEAGAVYLFSY